MDTTLDAPSLDRLFAQARTHSTFLPREVDDAVLRRLYELAHWGPTSMNCQPARWVFVRSAAEKARLLPLLAPGNQDKVRAAPATVIVAYDSRFFEQLPSQFPVNPQAGAMFAANPELARETALRNSSLQGAYFMLAARALGLDVGPMSGFDAKSVNAVFFADSHWQANFLVNLGWGDPTTLRPRLPRLGFDAVARIV
jgi:3-hydroxypropanoate dehydrogenase